MGESGFLSSWPMTASSSSFARAAGRVYNLGEERAFSEGEWVWILGELTRWTGRVNVLEREELPEDEREPYDFEHNLIADTSRIRRELGFQEKVGRVESLRRAIAAIRPGS